MTTAEVPVHNLTIYQGATFRKRLEYRSSDGITRVPLNGLSGRMHVRDKPRGTLLISPEVVVSQVEDPDDPMCGVVDLYISASDTANLEVPGVFDIELFDPADPTEVTRFLMGEVLLSREVTT